MKRLHTVGGKNHGKTTLVVELVKEFTQRGIATGTINLTHHHHEFDVPGKDSFRHRKAGASVVGILSPSMTAISLPPDTAYFENHDRYSVLAPMFAQCRLVLVEGDSQTTFPKIEVWRSELRTPPLAIRDNSILGHLIVNAEPLTG